MLTSILAISLTCIGFSLFYLLVEYITFKANIDTNISRKILHIFSGFGAILASYFITSTQFLVTCLVFMVLFSFNYKKRLIKSILVCTRITLGEIFFPLGLIIMSLYLYQDKILFVMGILILAIPDTLAGLTGFYLKSEIKTILGSFFYLISSCILLSFLGVDIRYLGYAGIFTLIEYFSPYGLDNLTVPLVYTLLFFNA